MVSSTHCFPSCTYLCLHLDSSKSSNSKIFRQPLFFVPIFKICTGTVVNNGKFCYSIHKRHITLLCLLGKRLETAFTCVFVRRHVYLWKGDWSHQCRGFFRFVPSIPDNQGYLRFSVFIGQQNQGSQETLKSPIVWDFTDLWKPGLSLLCLSPHPRLLSLVLSSLRMLNEWNSS